MILFYPLLSVYLRTFSPEQCCSGLRYSEPRHPVSQLPLVLHGRNVRPQALQSLYLRPGRPGLPLRYPRHPFFLPRQHHPLRLPCPILRYLRIPLPCPLLRYLQFPLPRPLLRHLQFPLPCLLPRHLLSSLPRLLRHLFLLSSLHPLHLFLPSRLLRYLLLPLPSLPVPSSVRCQMDLQVRQNQSGYPQMHPRSP